MGESQDGLLPMNDGEPKIFYLTGLKPIPYPMSNSPKPVHRHPKRLPAAILLLASFTFGALAQEKETAEKESGEALESVTRLQVFLDRAEFAPGKIDGRLGEFTLAALALYREAHGGGAAPAPKANEGEGDAPLELDDLDLASVEPLFLTYEVSEDDLQQVGELPGDISGQSKLEAMPYRSVAEAIAERFHMDGGYLDELNPGKTEDIQVGDKLRVANVVPFELGAVEGLRQEEEEEEEEESVADNEDEAVKDDEPGVDGVAPSGGTKTDEERILVNINTEANMLTVYEDEKLVAAYPVTIGSGQTDSPEGEWTVTGIAILPNFRHDRSMLKRGVRSDDFHMLPPGPNNPVGVVWIQLNKEGIGIHGTNDPGSIGRSSSHGCVRLANWDVVRLLGRISVGVPVTIQAGSR
jgi:lipoprotein-anchoring transpeptidase ErfK/SrfK